MMYLLAQLSKALIEARGWRYERRAARSADAVTDGPRTERPPRDPAHPLLGARIVVGVAGGIAAYKAAELVRLFDKAGARVDVAMTARAQEFVGPMTFQALTRGAVLTGLFSLSAVT